MQEDQQINESVENLVNDVVKPEESSEKPSLSGNTQSSTSTIASSPQPPSVSPKPSPTVSANPTPSPSPALSPAPSAATNDASSETDNSPLPIDTNTESDTPSPSVSTTNAPSPKNNDDNQGDPELEPIKKQALNELEPLVDELDQTPEDKFRTLLMIIQASDNKDLIQKAFDAAEKIEDKKTRAQALLSVVDEIEYFNGKSKAD